MVIISLIIVVLGFVCAVGLYSGLTSEIAKGADSELVLQGYDIVDISEKAGKAGALVLSVLTVLASFALVAVQWISFAIVKAIKGVVSKNNNY